MRRKGFVLLPVLIIVILIVALGFVFEYFRSNKDGEEKVPQTVSPTSNPITSSNKKDEISSTPKVTTAESPTPKENTSPSPSPTPTDKIWKGLGVTFSYPSNWIPNRPISNVQTPQSGGYYQQSFKSKVNENNSMLLQVHTREKNVEGNFKSLEEQYRLPNIKKITIAGKDGVTARYESGNLYQFFIASLLYDDTTVSIMIYAQKSSPDTIKEAETVYNQVLSTFKFIR